MATAPVERERSSIIEDRFLRYFGLGFAAIVAAKLLLRAYPLPGGLLAAALGVALMWWYSRGETRDRPREEWSRLGDEVYYLGLLFTLTSLCAALVTLFLLGSVGDDVAVRIDHMIGSFGIALLTTMAGIVLRTVLQQPGVAGTETVIRIPSTPLAPQARADGATRSNGVGAEASLGGDTVDLERYAYELRRQLESASNAFASLGNQVFQQAELIQKQAGEVTGHLRRRAEEAAASIETEAAASAEGLAERANTEIERLQTAYAEAARGAEAAAKAAAAQQEGVRRVLESLAAHVTRLEGGIARMGSASANTAETFSSIAENVGVASERFEVLIRAQADHDRLLETATGRLRTLLATAERGLEGRSDMGDAIRSLGEMAATADRYAGAMQAAEREVRRTTADFKRLQATVQQEGMGLAQAVRDAVAAVEEARLRKRSRGPRRWALHRIPERVSRFWKRTRSTVPR